MKIKLVFDDWRTYTPKDGLKSIYNSEAHISLSTSDFHSGTTFDAEIHLNPEQEEEFKSDLAEGFIPVFWVGRYT